MKRNFLYAGVMFAVLAATTTVYAQMGAEQSGQWGHGQGPMSVEQRMAHMTKALNLSDAQQQQIRPILENESKQMEGLHSDTSLSQQDRMGKMMQIRQATNDQIKPILNADQQQKYEQMMMHGAGHHHGGPDQMAPQSPPPQQ